jgi:hypothetical protein
MREVTWIAHSKKQIDAVGEGKGRGVDVEGVTDPSCFFAFPHIVTANCIMKSFNVMPMVNVFQ